MFNLDDSTNQNISTPRGLIIYQHEGRLVLPPDNSNKEHPSTDGPFYAVIAIGSLFLFLTTALIAASLIFLHQKKSRNKHQIHCNIDSTTGSNTDVFINPRSEWRCSLDSDSFADLSDISVELELDKDTEVEDFRADDCMIYANPKFCPKHSRITTIDISDGQNLF